MSMFLVILSHILLLYKVVKQDLLCPWEMN